MEPSRKYEVDQYVQYKVDGLYLEGHISKVFITDSKEMEFLYKIERNESSIDDYVPEHMILSVFKPKPTIDPNNGIFGALSVVGKSESGNEVIFKIKDTLFELNTTEIMAVMQGFQFGYESIKPPKV